MKSYDIVWKHILKSHEHMTVCCNMLQWLWKWQPAAWCTEGLNAGLRIHRRMGHTQPGFQGGSGQYRQGLLQKAHASNIFKWGSQLKSKLTPELLQKKPQHTATLRKQNMQILQDVATHDPSRILPWPPGRTKVFGSVPATRIDACHSCGHESEKVRFHQKQYLQYVIIQINSTHQQFPLHLRKQSGMSTMKHPRNRLES